MGSKEFGNTYDVGGEDIGATGVAGDHIGEHEGTQQEEKRYAQIFTSWHRHPGQFLLLLLLSRTSSID